MKTLLLLALVFLSGQSQIIAHKPLNTDLNRKVLRLAREGTIEAAKEFFKGEEMPDMNVRGRAGFTPLMFAAERGQVELAEMLIDHGALVNIQNDAGQTACIIAAEKGYTNMVELLFDAAADLNIRDNNGRTALINAILNGKLAAAVLLIQVKVDLNAQDKDGNTALIYAAANGQRAIVNLLIAAQANLLLQNNLGESALDAAFRAHYAIGYRDENDNRKYFDTEYCGNDLLKAGSKINRALDSTWWAYELSQAAKDNYIDRMNLLIKAHANINQDYKGHTPLMIAVINGRPQMVKLLVEAGADMSIKDPKGFTAYGLANNMLTQDMFGREIQAAIELKADILKYLTR